MYKKNICKVTEPALLLTAVIFLSACNNEDTKKIPDTAKDTVAVTNSAKNTNDSTNTTATVKIKEERKDSSKQISSATQNAADKIKNKAIPNPDKKKSTAKDSTTVAKKTEIPSENKPSAPATDNNKTTAPDNSKTDKPFVSKYGIIPRNTTENNITSFLNAFPDKHTIIKVNFDDDPDAEMLSVKAQIIKILKKTGYTNINEQSLTQHPMRIPKEIHYELQHDGTVVIWVAPANVQ